MKKIRFKKKNFLLKIEKKSKKKNFFQKKIIKKIKKKIN